MEYYPTETVWMPTEEARDLLGLSSFGMGYLIHMAIGEATKATLPPQERYLYQETPLPHLTHISYRFDPHQTKGLPRLQWKVRNKEARNVRAYNL